MKKYFLPVALISLLSAMSVSCQKENLNNSSVEITESCTGHQLSYTINGVLHQATFSNDDDYNSFVVYLVGLAKEGYAIEFCNSDRYQSDNLSKETVVYTTKSSDDAAKWGATMADAGYSVTISYDDETGIYTCIARR